MVRTDTSYPKAISGISHQHIHDVDQDEIRINQRGCPLHFVEISHFDSCRWNGQYMSPQSFTLVSLVVQQSRWSCSVEELRYLESFVVHECVDEHSIRKKYVVHDAEYYLLAKMRHRCKAACNADWDAHQFPSEYQVAVHVVEQIDVKLKATEVRVGDPNTPPSAATVKFKNILLSIPSRIQLSKCK